jgi:hypothetical protein
MFFFIFSAQSFVIDFSLLKEEDSKQEFIEKINEQYSENLFYVYDIKTSSKSYLEIIYKQKIIDEECPDSGALGQVYYYDVSLDHRSEYSLILTKSNNLRNPYFLLESKEKSLKKFRKNPYGFITSKNLIKYLDDESCLMEIQQEPLIYQALILELPSLFLGFSKLPQDILDDVTFYLLQDISLLGKHEQFLNTYKESLKKNNKKDKKKKKDKNEKNNAKLFKNYKELVRNYKQLSPNHMNLLNIINENFQSNLQNELFSIQVQKKEKIKKPAFKDNNEK